MSSLIVNSKLLKRFWSKTRPRRNGCIEWIAAKDKDGYGYFKLNNKQMHSHRVSWILTNGEIPEHDSYHGYCVCHKCDNSSCVNPNHLFLGTAQDNIDDKIHKGRQRDSHGENHPSVRLTDSDVISIRIMYETGKHTMKSIGDKFGITRKHTGQIINRKRWSHI